MAYKVKSKQKRRLPKGFGPFLAHVAAVIAAAVLAILLPKPKQGRDWILVACGVLIAAGAVAAAVTWCARVILGKRARSRPAARVFTIIYRVCFVLASSGVIAGFFRMYAAK